MKTILLALSFSLSFTITTAAIAQDSAPVTASTENIPTCTVLNAKQARCIIQKDDNTFKVQICSWTHHGAECN